MKKEEVVHNASMTVKVTYENEGKIKRAAEQRMAAVLNLQELGSA